MIDNAGRAVAHYPLTDELDIANLRRGLEELIRLHEAAGVEEMQALSRHSPIWRRGDDLEEFVRAVSAISLEPRQLAIF
ncbi:hypothetical protein, partial [Streptomyces galilaeus]|uniref:hypothetical protein n=1 Tax=Streptomyces galilaeus TaxID=33899 RepID=UPI0038F5E19E